jgi:hypothetical protein
MGLSSTPRELQTIRVEGERFHRGCSKDQDDGQAAQLRAPENGLVVLVESLIGPVSKLTSEDVE